MTEEWTFVQIYWVEVMIWSYSRMLYVPNGRKRCWIRKTEVECPCSVLKCLNTWMISISQCTVKCMGTPLQARWAPVYCHILISYFPFKLKFNDQVWISSDRTCFCPSSTKRAKIGSGDVVPMPHFTGIKGREGNHVYGVITIICWHGHCPNLQVDCTNCNGRSGLFCNYLYCGKRFQLKRGTVVNEPDLIGNFKATIIRCSQLMRKAKRTKNVRHFLVYNSYMLGIQRTGTSDHNHYFNMECARDWRWLVRSNTKTILDWMYKVLDISNQTKF